MRIFHHHRWMSCPLLLIGLGLFPLRSWGADAIWNSTIDGNWSDASNWTAPPDGDVFVDGGNSGHDVTVTVNAAAAPETLTIDEGDGVVLANGRSLTISGGRIDNAGTLHLDSTGAWTDLRIDGNTLFSGSGETSMSDDSHNRIYALRAADVLTVAADHTVSGAGQVGVNLAGIVNDGRIKADQPTHALSIDPSATGLVNNGMLQANDDGTLQLKGGTYSNANGTIQAIDNGVVELHSGANLVGGLLRSADGGVIRIPNGRNPLLTGTVRNNTTIEQNSTGSWTDLKINGDVTLTGSGGIAMSDDSHNRIYGVSSADVMTIGADQSISGAGQMGVNLAGFVNNGLIDANRPGNPLVIDPSSAGFANNGTLQASDRGTLHLKAGTFTNTNGAIHAIDDAAVELGTNGNIVGGTILSSDRGVVRIPNGKSPLFTGTIENEAVIQQTSTGAWTDLKINGDVTLTGSGGIAMSDDSHNRIYGVSSTDVMTIGVDQSISGAGQMGVNLAGFVNNGLIDANRPGNALVLDPSAAGFVNNATLQASEHGTLQLKAGTFNNTDGTVQAIGDGAVEFRNGSYVAGGTLRATDRGVVRIPNGQSTTFAGTITNDATIQQVSNGGWTDLRIEGDVTLTGIGGIAMTNDRHNRIYGVDADAELTVDTNQVISGQGQILVDVDNNGAISGHSASAPMEISGELRGVGDLENVRVSSLHAPGASPASISLRGLYELTPRATLALEIGGPTPGAEHDRLDSTGDVVLDGTLSIEQIDLGSGVFQPVFGDAFVVVDAEGELTGAFDRVDVLNLTPELVYEVFYDYETDVVTLSLDTFFDADFDADGDVDGSDFLKWQEGFGLASDASQLDGDADEDGDVDGEDFLVWQNQFGASIGGGGGGGGGSEARVPEPTTTGLIVALVLCGWARRNGSI